MQLKNWLRKERILLSILGMYLVAALLLFNFYRHQINPDGIAYISIAEKYADGKFIDALNGYWGPLLSWLLIPFSLLDLNMQAGAKTVAVLSGLGTLILFWALLSKWRTNRKARTLATISLVPLVLYWALPSPITPDLLMITVMLAYIYLVPPTSWGAKRSILLGAIIAAGYYTKAYFLPFATVHLLAIVTWQAYLKRYWHEALHYYGAALMVAALLIAPWVGVLSAKYGEFTLSSTGRYNFSLLHPTSPGHPMHYQGLLPPTNDTAITIWEDPSVLAMPSWSPIRSSNEAKHYVQTVISNIRTNAYLFFTFSVFSLAILAVGLLSLHKTWATRNYLKFILVLAIVLYSAGYSLLVVEERYLWPAFVLLVLLLVLLTEQHLKGRRLSYTIRIGIVMLMASTMINPVVRLYQSRNTGLVMKQQALALKPMFDGDEKVAANHFNAVFYCYYWQVRCYGALSPVQSAPQHAQQLAQYGITDYVSITPGPAIAPSPNFYIVTSQPNVQIWQAAD
jgi:hypothetical protein